MSYLGDHILLETANPKNRQFIVQKRDEDEKSYLKIVSFEWLKSKSSNVLKYLKLEESVNNVIWHQS